MDLVAELKKLDWSNTLSNGNNFIDNDKAYNDSATFKIIRGVFTNPYDQILEFPDKINQDCPKTSPSKKPRCTIPDKINEDCPKTSPSKKPRCTSINTQSFLDDPAEMPMSSTNYTGPLFPYKSTLTPVEHKIGLKVLLQHLNNDRLINFYNPFKNPTAAEMNKFQNILLPKIFIERQDFVKHLQEMWKVKLCYKLIIFRPNHEIFVNDMWRTSLKQVKLYPQKYQMITTLPLSGSDDPVELERIKILKPTKNVGPSLNLSIVRYPLHLFKHLQEIRNKSVDQFKEVKFSVSKDKTCEEFAKENLVCIVISPECIKCLVNNLSNLKHSWNIPIDIKEYALKDSKGAPFKHSVAYFNSPLPPQRLTEKDKNEWLCKVMLKHILLSSRKKVSQQSKSAVDKCDYCKAKSLASAITPDADVEDNSSETENSVSDLMDVDSEKSDDDEDRLVMDVDEKIFSTPTTGVMTRSRTSKIMSQSPSPNAPKPKVSKKEKNIPETNNSQMCTCEKKPKQITDSDPPLSEDDFTYSLLRLRQSSDVNRLSKTAKKDIKILVRSKADGEFEYKGVKGIGIVDVKLEFQMPYGYECTSPTEAANQWTMLNFVPDSTLFRGRIIADSGKLCMLEQFNGQTFNGEIAKQNSWTTAKAKSVLLNIFSALEHIRPGQYLLSHTERFGAFAALYMSVPSEVDATLDLNEFFHPKIVTEISLDQDNQWNPVDCSVPTNLNIKNEMMPSMFNPRATSFYVPKTSSSDKMNLARSINKRRIKKNKKKRKKSKKRD